MSYKIFLYAPPIKQSMLQVDIVPLPPPPPANIYMYAIPLRQHLPEKYEFKMQRFKKVQKRHSLANIRAEQIIQNNHLFIGFAIYFSIHHRLLNSYM